MNALQDYKVFRMHEQSVFLLFANKSSNFTPSRLLGRLYLSPLSIPSKIYISIIEHMFMLPISLLSPSQLSFDLRDKCAANRSIDWSATNPSFFSLLFHNRQVELMLFIRTLYVQTIHSKTYHTLLFCIRHLRTFFLP